MFFQNENPTEYLRDNLRPYFTIERIFSVTCMMSSYTEIFFSTEFMPNSTIVIIRDNTARFFNATHFQRTLYAYAVSRTNA